MKAEKILNVGPQPGSNPAYLDQPGHNPCLENLTRVDSGWRFFEPGLTRVNPGQAKTTNQASISKLDSFNIGEERDLVSLLPTGEQPESGSFLFEILF